jgi:hypothetical protein
MKLKWMIHISLDDVDDVKEPKNKQKWIFSSVLRYYDPDIKLSLYINRKI